MRNQRFYTYKWKNRIKTYYHKCVLKTAVRINSCNSRYSQVHCCRYWTEDRELSHYDKMADAAEDIQGTRNSLSNAILFLLFHSLQHECRIMLQVLKHSTQHRQKSINWEVSRVRCRKNCNFCCSWNVFWFPAYPVRCEWSDIDSALKDLTKYGPGKSLQENHDNL